MRVQQGGQATMAIAEGQRGGRHVAGVEGACLGLPAGEQVFQIADQARHGVSSVGVLLSTGRGDRQMQAGAASSGPKPEWFRYCDGRRVFCMRHTCASHSREEGGQAVFCRGS
ncbi:hypothetical protein XAP6164_3230020 [Xanthomonas phaseoli pv. phaseoli]|nr:hypothetical protein XAP6164_3230020 [Xanthomonas phaseoli pv. phaseoli]